MNKFFSSHLRLACFCLLCLLSVSRKAMATPASDAASESRIYSLVAWTKDGEQIAFPFEDEPRITIEDTQFVVSSLKLTMEYAITDIERFTLLEGDEATGMESVRAESLLQTEWQRDHLSVSGMAAQSVVRVMTVGGSMVKQMRADAYGRVSLSMTDLPKGIYLVQTPTKTFKIRK